LSGRTLGHFQVGAVLGRGFHGVVFEARDINKDQAVALKILRPPFPVDEKEMSQFTQTLKTILPLRHPHLLAVYGAGKAGSYCWIAREPVEGKTLAQILARVASQRKLNWLNGLRVAIHVGRALHYLHEHRVMHGDVTPHNILVRSKDKHTSLYNVMLLKALEGSRLQEQTLEGKLLAELGYLAPEQADPDAFVDELNDIYGLGAVVYARLTGRPPFQGDSPEETLTNIREGPLVKPRKIQPSIPEPMERVVLRMLARRQEDRYQNVADVVADLDRIAQKEGVQL
jgi:serine/threonine-protein kinase